MDPIEISSSDTDSEFGTDDEDPEVVNPPATSASSSRHLPDWTSTSTTSSTIATIPGYGERSQKAYYPRMATGSNGRPSFSIHRSQTEDHSIPHDRAGFHSSTLQMGQGQDVKYFGENGRMGQLGNIANTGYEKHYMEQSERRALPSSFQSSALLAKHNSFGNAEHLTQMNGSRRSYYSAMPSVANGKNFMKDDGADVLDNRSRILPFSLVHGSGVPPGRYPGPSDFSNPSTFRIGEERIGGPDETIIYREAVQGLNQPKQEYDIPDGLLSVPLLRHQKIALAWMLQKEARTYCVGGILADDQGLGKTVSMIALIQIQRYLDSKSKPEDNSRKAEALTLDDDDDNGNASSDNVKKTEDSEGTKVSSEAISSQMTSNKQRPAAGTLIVCPATVLRQWARELNDKVDPEAKLNVLVYHGSNRTKDPSELANYDVVLTTYALVNNEVPKQPVADEDDGEQKAGEKYGLHSDISMNKKRKNLSSTNRRKKGRKGVGSCSLGSDVGTLARVRWLRVVLDEAQTIKNHRTQVARACCSLRAKRRWCLSGTPMQNSIDELFSYFKFLKYDPYSGYKAFSDTIKAPISRDSDTGYKKLQIILKNVMLRRTKDTRINGEPIISLPPKFIKMESVNFTKEERAFYAKLEADSQSKFKAYAAAGTVSQNYANILLMLLRLRQACDHPFLVCGFSSETVKNTASIQTLNQLPRDMLVNLLYHLESSPICQTCEDPPEDAVVAMCGHVFCHQCLLDHLEGDDNTCPACRCKEQLSTNVVFSKASLKSCLFDGHESSLSNGSESDWSSAILMDAYSSSKIRAAVEILKSLGKPGSTCIDLDGSSRCNGEYPCIDKKIEAHSSYSDVNVRTEVISSSVSQVPPRKAIVFSQWTRMLDLFESALVQSEIQYRRLDGNMSLSARDKAVREFSTDPEVTVMLMSLKAGNLGLNMVAASYVILLDLWWNPTTEDQAIDRTHRIGQTRPVTVSRLTIKDTVEDRILSLQEEKRKMVASAFGEEGAGAAVSRLSAEDLRYLFLGR